MSENLKEKQDATGYQFQFQKIHGKYWNCWVWQPSTNSVHPDWNNDLCSPTLKNHSKNGIWKHGVSATNVMISCQTESRQNRFLDQASTPTMVEGPRSPAKHSFLRICPCPFARLVHNSNYKSRGLVKPCSIHVPAPLDPPTTNNLETLGARIWSVHQWNGGDWNHQAIKHVGLKT